MILVHHAPPREEFDRKFVYVSFGILATAIVLFTYLHHFQPQVLHVPSNTDVTQRKNPTFEQTCIYDRMTEAERAKVRAEGIPGDNLPAIVFMELFSAALAWLCFVHARRHYGVWMACAFLLGSFVFTGMQESMWILIGRFTGKSAMTGVGSDVVYGTYWFPKGGLWFIETPVAVCLGWFFIAYGCVWIAGKVFPRAGLLTRAAVGGLIAMILDLWQDPVATSPELMSWVWAKGDFLRIFGIPHTNFLGWFLLIFCFAVFWEWLPAMEQRWGRFKATLTFFALIFVTEVLILVFMFTWGGILQRLMVAAGFDHGIQLPPGW